MNHQLDKLRDEISDTWRYRWWALAVASALAVLGWLLVFTLPDRYEARASVLVDTRTALKPALEGLALQQDVGVELNYVRESLLTDPRLLEVAKSVGLLATPLDANSVRQDRVIADLRKHVQLIVMGSDDRPEGLPSGGITYEILYQDKERIRALNVVNILLRNLVNETLGGNKQGSEHAQEFLESQVKDYEQRLRAAEDRLADFKSRHFGLMPSDQGGYFAQLQKETENTEDVRTKLLVAESRHATLEKQLHGDAALSAIPALTAGSGTGTAGGVDTLSRIAQTRAHLDELLLKYTDNHPDVIETRKNLAELEKRRAAEIESLKNGDASAAAATGASGNPVYQSIELELNKVEVEISDLRTQLAEHENKAQQLRQLLHTAPQIEAEYAQLNRDYDVNKAQYTALLSSYEKARLGERANNAGSVKFQVVEPPIVSPTPVWPRRTKYLFGIFFAALVAGVVVANRLGRLRPTVGTASSLTALTGVPVLAVLGSAYPELRRRTLRREIWKLSAVAMCLLLAFVAVLALSSRGIRLALPPALQQLV